MFPRPALAAVGFVSLLVVASFAPLAGASTGPTPNGDVVVNGAFADPTPVGHPLKFYCDATNPTPLAGPGGECAHRNTFVAFDWTTPVESEAAVSLVEGGLRLVGNVFVQQHFNGSEAPDRIMQIFHVTLTGSASAPGKGGLRLEIRADADGNGAAESYTRALSFGTSPTTVDVSAATLGLPSGSIKVRSVRLWADAGADLTLHRASVYATNGIETRNLHVAHGGDDVVTPLGPALLLAPGDDGAYTFLVGMAADNGDFLPTLDAWLCLYDAERAIADRGFPANVPTLCQGAYVGANDPRVAKSREGDAFRFDVPASIVAPAASAFPAAYGVYAIVKVDSSYDVETPGVTHEYKSGYLHAARSAADAAGFGVSREYSGPTPVLVDADADGTPDYAEIDQADGYSVIITPQLATPTPLATVVAAGLDAAYRFDVEVWSYRGGMATQLDLPRGVHLGIFDAEGLVNGGAFDAAPLWDSDGADLTRLDAKTWRVRVPADEVPSDRPLGVWAYYDVGDASRHNVLASHYGPADSAFDFYSATRTAVKAFPVADALRDAGTPILFDRASSSADATFVVRVDPDADELTPLDGTLVAGDGGDGSITFEYALLGGDGRAVVPSESHGLAIYDAAGAASDRFAPGTSALEHAEWVGRGVLQADGWFRVDVPLSAFDAAKGAVGAWGYADTLAGDGTLVSRSGWYNLLKPAAAAISTSAAEATLYAPTPVVVLDAGLGIPRTLAAALAGAGKDVLSVTNPLVNPGFEADLLVEGAHDANDGTGGTMTSPPWFFRLDDRGTGQPTNPRSTHEVQAGRGRLGDHALKISLHQADRGKSLMLGQLLGAEQGGDALVWRGATGAAFDLYPAWAVDTTFTAVIRWLDASGTVQQTSATRAIGFAGATWQRVSFTLPVPADGRLLGFYLVMDAEAATSFYLDNLALQGARTALGDARTDVTDGFAVVITPEGLAGTTQGLTAGSDGAYYAYVVEVVDYTQGGARALDVAGLPRSFALRTEELQHSVGSTLPLRGRTDAFAAVVPAAHVPADLAVPWAFVDAGDPYFTLGSSFQNHPASGHFNPVKNAIRAMPLADQLDYAATPIGFGNVVAQTRDAPQSLRVTPVQGGYGVIVAADSPYVETTTLTVTAPAAAPRSYPVTLTRAEGDLVPGLVLTADELGRVTLTSAGTRFTRGATLVAGTPLASFEICRVGIETCLDVGAKSGDALLMRSTSLSPTGEPLTLVWRFGDGATSTEVDTETTHAYARPGSFVVNLTVQTPSGKRGYAEHALTIGNRDPTLFRMDVTPGTVYADSRVNVRAFAGDSDGGALSYAWSLDGVSIPGAGGAVLTLTPAVLEAATGQPTLARRSYEVAVTVTDGQGGLVSGLAGFTVQNRPASVGAPSLSVVGHPSAGYALVGESVAITVRASDPDDALASVVAEVVHAGASTFVPLDRANGDFWTGRFEALAVGAYAVRATATDATSVETAGASASIQARVDAPPVVTIRGPGLVQEGEEGLFVVEAVDPDGRGVAGTIAWTVDGAVAGTGLALAWRFTSVGVVALAASVDGGSGTHEVAVDDAVRLELSMHRVAVNGTDSHQILLRAFASGGGPLAHTPVLVEDLYSVIPRPVDSRVLHTDENGEIVIRVRPEGLVIGLPLDRTIRTSVEVASIPGAPVSDLESASAEIRFRNPAGPLAGLPLP